MGVVRTNFYGSIALLASCFLSLQSRAGTIKVPEEYESTGGHSLAFGGSVATGLSGVSAVRSNPALLGLEREYSVSGAYHWPVAGRDFYQLGVVDGKTSAVAAGVSYTSSLDHYQGITDTKTDETSGSQVTKLSADSPITRRANLAFAIPVGRLFLGAAGGYIEARPPAESLLPEDSKPLKSFTLGFGAAAHLTPSLRLGISAENLANKKIQYAAPTFYRAGASYFFGDVATLNLDYRRREAVSVYEGATPSIALAGTSAEAAGGPENLIVGSAAVKIYDLLRLIASVGQQKSNGYSATRLGGGISLVNQQFNFSYQVLRSDISSDLLHHAIALGLEISM